MSGWRTAFVARMTLPGLGVFGWLLLAQLYRLTGLATRWALMAAAGTMALVFLILVVAFVVVSRAVADGHRGDPDPGGE